MTAFARRHQLSLHRLQWWRAQLSQRSTRELEQVRLLPVLPRQAPLIAMALPRERGELDGGRDPHRHQRCGQHRPTLARDAGGGVARGHS